MQIIQPCHATLSSCQVHANLVDNQWGMQSMTRIHAHEHTQSRGAGDIRDALELQGRRKLLTLVLAIDDVLLPALDAPGVHQLGLAAGDQHDGAFLVEGTHKGAAADLPQATPAAQVPHQLHPY